MLWDRRNIVGQMYIKKDSNNVAQIMKVKKHSAR